MQNSLSAGRPRKSRNGFLAALELVVKHGREGTGPARAAPYRKRCPKCGWTGLTDQDFGMRTIRGRQVPQSWCRLCRRAAAETEARKRTEQLGRRTEELGGPLTSPQSLQGRASPPRSTGAADLSTALEPESAWLFPSLA